MYGYYFDSEGNPINWFRGADKSNIIVTDETKYEYEKIWKSKIDLERYTINEDTIVKVIYGGTYKQGYEQQLKVMERNELFDISMR